MIVRQFVKFSIVGVINTGIHYAAFLLLYRIVNINYLIASVMGYCCGLLNSYLMNRKWTFNSGAVAKQNEIIKFLVVNVTALGINVASLRLLVESLGIKPEISQLASIGFSLVVNFIGNKYWTFRYVKTN